MKAKLLAITTATITAFAIAAAVQAAPDTKTVEEPVRTVQTAVEAQEQPDAVVTQEQEGPAPVETAAPASQPEVPTESTPPTPTPAVEPQSDPIPQGSTYLGNGVYTSSNGQGSTVVVCTDTTPPQLRTPECDYDKWLH